MQYISKLVEKHPEPKSDGEIWPVKGCNGWKKIVMRLDVLEKKKIVNEALLQSVCMGDSHTSF